MVEGQAPEAGAEIQRRLNDLASIANNDGIDVLVLVEPENVFYLSNFRTTLHTRFTAVALRTDDPENAVMIVPSVDRRLALEPIWSPSLIARTEVYFEGAPEDGPLVNDPRKVLDTVIQGNVNVGMDLEGAAYGHVKLILDRYPDVSVVDVSPALHRVRSIKSAAEIQSLREANRIAVDCLSTVRSTLREGMTEVELATHLDSHARKLGADGFAYPTLIGFGPKSLAPHAPPTLQTLDRDRIITIAFGPMFNGYCADIVRTFFYGSPPAVVEQSSKHALEMQDAAMAEVRAGARAGDLMVAALDVLAHHYPDAPKAGRAGHSLGLSVHEAPSLTPDNDTILVEDMVLAIEPGGAPFQMDGIGLYRQCDVVLVTKDGYERLTPFDRGIQVVA